MRSYIYESPIEPRESLDDAAGHQSFDVRKYMTEYKKRMMPAVRAR